MQGHDFRGKFSSLIPNHLGSKPTVHEQYTALKNSSTPPLLSASLRPLFLSIAVLLAGFSVPLARLAKFSTSDDLYSHIFLIPLVSLYLIWENRNNFPRNSAADRKLTLGLITAATILLLISVLNTAENQDDLALQIIALLLLLGSACAWFLGRARTRALAFPLTFLLFMVPFPSTVRHGLETFLQHGSAAVAHALFKLTGTPVFYSDLVFKLPGINLEVAPECSGIRSSLVLFITSVLAGHLFLRSPWKVALLSLTVVPLALLRNGFRVFTIGELCVRINPDMIDSYIHHKGGPIFFALSLVPFSLLLLFLLRSERRLEKNSA